MSDIWASAEAHTDIDLSFKNDITDYEMSTLSDTERAKAFKALLNPKNYEYPLPMPKTEISDTNWQKCKTATITGDFLKLTEWSDFLHELSKNHNITLHTHCMTPESAIARLKWLKREVNIDNICIKIDIGNDKSVSSCDLLFDDSLKNILKANAKCRCMPALFHNSYASKHNREIYEMSNKHDFVCIPHDFDAFKTAINAALDYINSDSTEKFSDIFNNHWKNHNKKEE